MTRREGRLWRWFSSWLWKLFWFVLVSFSCVEIVFVRKRKRQGLPVGFPPNPRKAMCKRVSYICEVLMHDFLAWQFMFVELCICDAALEPS